jgi:capsid protein
MAGERVLPADLRAVARGGRRARYISAPGFFSDPLIRAAWCGAEWHGPTQGQLDPRAEVEAAATRVAEGFSTRTQETRELTGGDFWTNERLRTREEEARGVTVSCMEPLATKDADPPAKQQTGANPQEAAA